MQGLTQMLDVGGQINVHITYDLTLCQLHTSAEGCTHAANIDTFEAYFGITSTEFLCDLRCFILRSIVYNNNLIIFISDLLQIFHCSGNTALQPLSLIQYRK